MFNNFFNKRRSRKFVSKIIMSSNVIQYDEMGYPLRLVMFDQEDGTVNHVWIDIDEAEVRESDVVLKWEVEEK